MRLVKCDRCGKTEQRDRTWAVVSLSGSKDVNYDLCKPCTMIVIDTIKVVDEEMPEDA